MTIADWTGYTIAEVDEHGPAGTEIISGDLNGVSPFLLLVEQFDDRKAAVRLEGDAALVPLTDPDDDVTLELPVRRIGLIDYPYDVDYFLLSLQAGETVRVLVDSVLVDPLLPDSTTDDDSGGGLFGFSAELIFRADVARVYRIVINDPGGDTGGYVLSIEHENGSHPN